MIPPITPSTRAESIDRLRRDTFDVLILGGGINGAGTARDLALRAKTTGAELNIALIDQNHFASGTSSRNSHLIHGGLRYLKQLAIHLVRESLRERAVLLKIAPHLVEPQPFLLPLAGLYKSLYYATGLTIYDLLDQSGALPRHRRVPLDEVRRLEPGLAAPGMTAAAEYYDGQVRSARLVLENIFEAAANGAACANYIRAVGRRCEEGGTWRVRLEDRVSGEMFETRARVIIDATGPWARDPQPRLVRGSHIILPRLNASQHAIAHFDDSGRIIFFIPWGERGDRTLIGTTDVDHDSTADRVEISADETRYLRDITARVFPESTKLETLATFSSLRPLLVSSGSATKATREHRIFFDRENILRITGGKYTTYRAMSEEAADLALSRLSAQSLSRVAPALQKIHLTAETPLNGNSIQAIATLRAQAPALAAAHALPKDEILFLIRQYGVLAPAVLSCVPPLSNSSTSPISRIDAARLDFAVRHEMAIYPSDFLEISTSLAHEGRAIPLESPLLASPNL
ncbi:MAG TPA: glycerol-3-phosphate dehydrogenase/oxidase [Bryobacteraceae bacterium]|nr:glycerol-3-phosphate dehydrogenase/oxidase [Bryobacteraceae bacterium]